MLNPIMTYEQERALADARDSISDVHVLIDNVQPIFQMAWTAATTTEEQAIVTEEWQALTDTLTQFKTVNQTAIDIMNNLREQKDIHAQELSDFVSQVRQATLDNETGHPDIYGTEANVYPPEIQNLVETVEHRIHVENEIHFERDFAKLNRDTYKSIVSDLSAMIAFRLDEHNLDSGKLLFAVFNNTSPLPADQRAGAASILRRLADQIEAQ